MTTTSGEKPNLSSSIRRLVLKQLQKVKFVNTKYEAQLLLDKASQSTRLLRGTEVVLQGKVSLGMFIVIQGEIQATVNGSKVYKFSPVSRFGERALFTSGELCGATCYVSSRIAQVLFISRELFRDTLHHNFYTMPLNSGTVSGRVVVGGHSARGMEKVVQFNGIRYGTAARWEPPVVFQEGFGDENRHRDALLHGAACAQAKTGVTGMLGGRSTDHPPSLLFASADPSRVVLAGGSTESEDCFFLNITAPLHHLESKSTRKLPVMVFVHGGAFVTGSGSVPLYNGKHLAVHGSIHDLSEVVVVTINYRLGALGFLAPPSTEYGVVPNLGLLDQICALRWVRNNISTFGGDVENVTVFGESAGAMSVSCLLGSPLRMYEGQALFTKVIAQSGSASFALNETQAARSCQIFLEHLYKKVRGTVPEELKDDDPDGAGGVHQSPTIWRDRLLHEAPLSAIISATESAALSMMSNPKKNAQHLHGRSMLFQPSVVTSYHDSMFEGVHPITRIANGAATDVDLLIGLNRDEYGLFMIGGAYWKGILKKVGGNIIGFQAELQDRLERYVEGDGRWRPLPEDWKERCRVFMSKLRKLSVEEDVDDVRHQAEAMFEKLHTAWLFGIPAIRMADAHADSMAWEHQEGVAPGARKGKTFFYRLDYSGKISSLRTFHALDIPLMFGTWKDVKLLRAVFGKPSAKDANHVSDEMMKSWVSFACSGVPSPAWGEYTAQRRCAYVFGHTKNRFGKQVLLKDTPETLLEGICEPGDVLEKPKKPIVSRL